ncbi:hypothetical protein M2323_001989 [Rhodoblastus acidophilus]|uniref:hypothetical protein n=1 Tax=Rhodoblastus acidophilus TaxID=1074 RepID=UPI00222435D9|nr:hypothetical protein [Rhodoblastus acidophilus]MCW2285695.1 hypothetical protein [Rhodoblastus acidophilus]MCW2333067.1 hypothetical protein [Rhodoblastus acidophilus]
MMTEGELAFLTIAALLARALVDSGAMTGTEFANQLRGNAAPDGSVSSGLIHGFANMLEEYDREKAGGKKTPVFTVIDGGIAPNTE